MPKYNVLFSYITEAPNELKAMFNAQRVLNYSDIPESELDNFEAFHIEEIK